jgi:hypothetical protein
VQLARKYATWERRQEAWRYAFDCARGDGDLTLMTQRRYTDEEITTIFHVAAEAVSTPLHNPSGPDGLSLADLQAIGREVGIPPDAVARAAKALEVRQGAVSRTFLGLPVGVERRTMLDHRLTDEEWEQLVVRLRDVFQARGRTESNGSLRQWTNGNLYVLLEPTPTGDRLRLGSLHRGATASLRLGLASLAGAAIFAIANVAGGQLASMGTVAGLSAAGVFLLANGALRLRGWARLRGRQMEDVAAQLALPPGSTALPDSREPHGIE